MKNRLGVQFFRIDHWTHPDALPGDASFQTIQKMYILQFLYVLVCSCCILLIFDVGQIAMFFFSRINGDAHHPPSHRDS